MGAWASGEPEQLWVGLGALGPTGIPGHLCPSAGCLYTVPVMHLGVGEWEGVCGVWPLGACIRAAGAGGFLAGPG